MADPEIQAMEVISGQLELLENEQRQRVLRWALERFNATSNSRGAPASQASPALQQHKFQDFAALYSSANPKSDKDKALVAGFWLQTTTAADWDTFRANEELRQVGHPIPNIALAVLRLKPKFVMQTKNTGGSGKARKMYRLTAEGTKRVEALIAGEQQKEED